jgi:hypothetical protein
MYAIRYLLARDKADSFGACDLLGPHRVLIFLEPVLRVRDGRGSRHLSRVLIRTCAARQRWLLVQVARKKHILDMVAQFCSQCELRDWFREHCGTVLVIVALLSAEQLPHTLRIRNRCLVELMHRGGLMTNGGRLVGC